MRVGLRNYFPLDFNTPTYRSWGIKNLHAFVSSLLSFQDDVVNVPNSRQATLGKTPSNYTIGTVRNRVPYLAYDMVTKYQLLDDSGFSHSDSA